MGNLFRSSLLTKKYLNSDVFSVKEHITAFGGYTGNRRNAINISNFKKYEIRR